MKLAHLNVRSLVGKVQELREHIMMEDYDIVGITETWLEPNILSNNVSIDAYNFIRLDRSTRGGGIGMYVKKNLRYTILETDSSIEQLWIKLKLDKLNWCIGCIYRAPGFNCNNFIDIFENTLSSIIPFTEHLVCMGDFNIDLLKLNTQNSQNFTSLLDSVGLVQIIQEPTRIAQNCATLIDLFLISDKTLVTNSGVRSLHSISDHELIYCNVNSGNSGTPMVRSYRDYKNINYDSFNSELHSIPWNVLYDLDTIDGKVTYFNESLMYLQNRHAPIVTRTFYKPHKPWITDNIKYLKNLRNKALTKFKRTKNPQHWSYYKQLRNLTTSAIKREKKAYLEQRLQDGSNMWDELNKMNIYNKKSKAEIPEKLCNANAINTYFIDSLPKVDGDIEKTKEYYENQTVVNNTFRFKEVDEITVLNHLSSIKSRAAGSDGIEIEFIKLCCPYLLPYLTHIINFCIKKSVFPLAWKIANVTPVPKVANPETVKDLRPINILPVLSKILEGILNVQLREHLESNGVLPLTQSGFRKGHSCCSALLNVTDDIFAACDNGYVTVLVLLDYSRAFDTINHEILLSILKYVGIGNEGVLFFRNYLANRTQRVTINNDVSDALEVKTGVPQGSILGPLLYIVYTSQLQNQIRNCKMQYYADDTQICLSFPPSLIHENCVKINEDLNRLYEMSKQHSLFLNPNKSVLMVYGRKKDREHSKDLINININNLPLEKLEQAKNLGIIFDSNLRFKKHVSSLVKKAYCKLKMLFNSRHLLSTKLKILLCDTLVLSQFNYCDVVYGPCLDQVDIKRIQKVQNSCLRFIYGIRRGRGVSHKLSEANWLNMAKRRKLHSASFYHSIICNKTPEYLYNKITFRCDVHNINIRFRNTVTPPMHRTALFERSFSYNMSQLYNTVPPELKTLPCNNFKKQYREYLSSI